MFDHVAIAVSDLAASERFYRTVLSVLGVEPIHADAEIVEWLFREDETLSRRPIDALRANRSSAVKRLAQVAGY